MSDTVEYKFDVFVSYAGNDNAIPNGVSKGWVSVFVETLLQEFGMTQLGKAFPLKIWWDANNLDRTGNIQKELLDILPSVRVVVVLLSPAYLQSDWCRQERERFLSAMQDRPLAEKRVFLIDLGKVDKDDRPEPFRGMLGFSFHDQSGMRFGYRIPNADRADHVPYWVTVPLIAEKIAERLEQITPRLATIPSPVVAVPPDPIATVYLAETTEDLDSKRQETAMDLKQHGFRVVPERRLRSDLDECRKQIQEAIEQSGAKVFVQLLEPKLGKSFDDSSETIVTLQHQIAVSQKMTVLQWRGPGVDYSSVTNPVLKALLAHPDVSADQLETFKGEVRKKATPARRSGEVIPGESRPKIYVHSDVVDDAHAKELARMLKERYGVVSAHTRRSKDPDENVRLRDRTKEWLQELCDGVVILYGKVGTDWVEDQLEEMIKVKSKRARPLRLEALYIGPPQEKEDPSIFDPEVQSIDARMSEQINFAALEPLIQPLFKPAGSAS